MNANTQSLDLLSKLLASENIKLVRANARTASFNIATRVLQIPAQLNLTAAQELMMVLHEVGHALFTTESYSTAIKQANLPNFDSYMNVVEDARIERLMKVRYPGARKDFSAGYTECHRSDFFKLSGRDIVALPLIDRINLYFKLNLHIDVKFTSEERRLVRLVETAQSEQEVISVATEIYNFAKDNIQESNSNKQQEISFEDDELGDYEDSEDFTDESSHSRL